MHKVLKNRYLLQKILQIKLTKIKNRIMETTTKKKSDGATFANVKETISKIEKYVTDNGYQFKDRSGLAKIIQSKFNTAPVSTRMQKKLDNAMAAIEKYVTDNGYQFKDRSGLAKIIQSKFNTARVSTRMQKKLVNAMAAIEKHTTLKNINKFFNFLMKDIFKSESRVKVIKSYKEITIQQKRMAYKDALAKMKVALAEYKTEKGDFYKIKLEKKSA
jgi:hypothetical protein